MKNDMKKCPYCAEEIKEEAIKCKHCGTILTDTIIKTPEFGQYAMTLYGKIKAEYYNKFFHTSGSEKIIIVISLLTILIISTIYFFYFLGGLILTLVIMSEVVLIFRIMEKDLIYGFKKKILARLLLLPLLGFLIYFAVNHNPSQVAGGVSKTTKSIPQGIHFPVPTVISALPGNPMNSGIEAQKEEKNININIEENKSPVVEQAVKNEVKTIVENEVKNVNINVNVKYNIEVKEKIDIDYLERCKLNIEHIACALEMYSTDNIGDYPPSLDYLTDNGTIYIQAVPDCPLCRKPYIYQRGDNPDDYIIKCGGMNAHMSTGKVQAGNFPQCKPGLKIYFKDNEMEYSAGPVNKVIYYPVIIKD